MTLIDLLSSLVFPLLFVASFVIPIFAGVLEIFRNDKVGRLMGCFLLKQILDHPLIWMLIFSFLAFERSWDRNLSADPVPLLTILPVAFLTLVIVFILRDLFKNHWLPWVLVVGDFLRWYAAYTFFSTMDSEKEFINEFSLIFWCLYPIIVILFDFFGYISINRDSNSSN